MYLASKQFEKEMKHMSLFEDCLFLLNKYDNTNVTFTLFEEIFEQCNPVFFAKIDPLYDHFKSLNFFCNSNSKKIKEISINDLNNYEYHNDFLGIPDTLKDVLSCMENIIDKGSFEFKAIRRLYEFCDKYNSEEDFAIYEEFEFENFLECLCENKDFLYLKHYVYNIEMDSLDKISILFWFCIFNIHNSKNFRGELNEIFNNIKKNTIQKLDYVVFPKKMNALPPDIDKFILLEEYGKILNIINTNKDFLHLKDKTKESMSQYSRYKENWNKAKMFWNSIVNRIDKKYLKNCKDLIELDVQKEIKRIMIEIDDELVHKFSLSDEIGILNSDKAMRADFYISRGRHSLIIETKMSSHKLNEDVVKQINFQKQKPDEKEMTHLLVIFQTQKSHGLKIEKFKSQYPQLNIEVISIY